MIPFEKLTAPTRLYINGEYQDAAGGACFDNINPATGQQIDIAAKKLPKFTAGAALKKSVA